MLEDEPAVTPQELATDRLQADDDGPGCGCEQFNSCCFIDVVESLLFGGDIPRGISGSANFLIWCITPEDAKHCFLITSTYRQLIITKVRLVNKQHITGTSNSVYSVILGIPEETVSVITCNLGRSMLSQ
jgi:hypothetical protein